MALLESTPKCPLRSARRPKQCGWVHAVSAFLITLAVTFSAPAAEPPPSQEYQIKAVFLFNFAQFVEWPPSAFAGAEAPLVIGVLGRDPFGGALDEAVLDEKTHGRKFVIQRYSRVEEIQTCHILFVSRSESGRLPAISNAMKGRSILTVSDADGFTEQGGMIRFVMEQNKVRFRINLESAKTAGLTLSSKLLQSAGVVAGKG
jgi:hypothetical protein